jgi:7-keto-8-aminopelargonate synthetase-like enzyme
LVCAEGVYSASGDYGALSPIADACREHGAYLLVDEAHSALLTGPNGLGVSDAQGVLDRVDFLVLTFSKAFGGVGGAVIAPRRMIPYLNWYSKSRFFSCALDPAVTGGLCKVVELAFSPEGERRRERLHANAARMRAGLAGRVQLSGSESWVLPVIFGADELTLKVYDTLQRRGVDTSVMGYPATPKNQARARLFLTSQHSFDQIDLGARIICQTARDLGFATP